MDRNRIAAVLAAVLMVTSMVAVPGSVAAQSDSDPEPVPAAYYGNVTVDGDPAPAGTTVSAVVNGTVVDTLTVTDAGEYGSPGLSDENLVVTADNATSGTPIEFRVNGTAVTRTEPATVEWQPEDVRRVDLALNADGLFETEIVDVDNTVVAGGTISLEANVTNVAEATDTQTVNVTLDGETVDQRELEIGPNESTTFTDVLSTDADNLGEVSAGVESIDDSASETVTVDAPASFNITDLQTSNVRSAGESFNVTVDVENDGDREDTQNVTVTYDGEVVYDRAETLAGGDSETINVEVDTEPGEAGTRTVVAETDDDRAVASVDLDSPAFFAVDVIEFDSETEAVPGQNITVAAEITNTGEEDGTQSVTISANGTDEQTIDAVDVDAGETRFIERELDTSTFGTGPLTIGVDTGDTSDQFVVDLKEGTAPTFEVDITDAPGSVDEPVDNVNITVDVNVENVGQQNGTQDIDFRVDGETRATENGVSLDRSSDTDLNVEVPIRRGDAPSVDVTVASENGTATESVEVDALPRFAVTDVNAPGRVNDTDEFEPNVTIENVGGQPANASVGVFFNATSIGTVGTDDSVSPGESVTLDNVVTLNASDVGVEDGNATQVEANVTNAETDEVDDFSTARVFVSENEPANFVVNSLGLAGDVKGDEVVAGESVEIDAEIQNIGGETGNQTVVLAFGGQTIAAETITLNGGGDTEIVEATYDTRSSDIGDGIDVTANTDNDDNTAELDVLEPAAFDAEIVAVDDRVIAGEELGVDVRVTNTGEANGTADLSVFLNGNQTSRSVELDAENSTVESVTFEPTTDQVGERDVAAATTDALDTATVSVGAPGELAVSFASVSNEITSEESFDATVLVENVGDGETTQTIALDASGLDASAEVTVPGGETRRVELSDATVPDAGTTVDVRAQSADDATATQTVSIIEPPEEATFALSAIETDPADGEVLEPPTGENTTVTVNTTVENVGDQSDTQSIELVVDDNVENNTDDIELDGGETRDVSLNLTVDDETPVGDLDVELRSENRTVTDAVTVTEAAPAELAIVDVADAEPVSAGDTLTANVTVENVGDRDLENGTVALDMVETSASTESEVDVNASETKGVEVGVTVPDEPRAGAFDRRFEVSVAPGGTDATQTFTETVDYGSVRSGVAEADSGDVVRIAPETYEESDTVVVDTQNVTLRGVGDTRPTIAPQSDETAVRVSADEAALERLVLSGNGNETAVVAGGTTTVESVEVDGWTTGVESTVGSLTVSSALVENVDDGIVLDSDDSSEIALTTVRASDTGVLAQAPDALLRDSTIAGAQTGVDVVGVTSEPLEVRRTTIRESTLGFRALNVPEDDLTVTVNNSNLESNELSVLADNSAVDATDNWWGQAGGAEPGDTLARSTVQRGDPLNSRTDSQFEVSIGTPSDLTNDSLVRGESYDVPVTIDNTDVKGDTQEIDLDVTGGPAPSTQDANVAGGSSQSLEFTLDVNRQFDDSIDLTASSLDDSSGTETVDVISFEGIEVSDTALTIDESATTQISVDETFSDGTAVDVTEQTDFESNDPGVATVASDGTITGSSPGTAEITATYERDGTAVTDTATVTVEAVEEPEPPEEGPEDPEDDDPVDDDPVDPGGGGGGGGGFVDDQQPGSLELDATATETVTPSLDLETDQRVATTESVENVESIAFDTTDQIGEVTVTDVDPETTDVDPPGGTVTLQEIAVPDDATDQSATIRFRVSAERLDAVGAPAEDLSAVRLTDDGWETLETSVAEETDEAVTLEAQTPGFSVFAVNAVGQPDATAAVDPGTATAGESVTLDGSGSTTEYGEIASYEWSVADQTLTGETASATLDEAGEYAVELTVTNDAGETDTATATLTVEAADDATADGADGADGADDAPDEEPAGLGVTVVVLLVAVAILAAAAVVLARREE
ncbi:PGF-pre-PGF domain-containing protein [Halorubrum sp. SD626R]|uniref:PGF-pre-PGF domain-containing protein n=1 Tax=Halorubrum sp. SD626R TaxID=1419722 RepID=UPI000B137593|nr:PGF-pre-PGF domain-containing protein [Halorubrum sp. SD626R]TKX80490.1 PGF-pre-PGF domain-containing protein [Halorubrum sp. SD626R]